MKRFVGKRSQAVAKKVIALLLLGLALTLFLFLLYGPRSQRNAEECPLAQVKMSATKTSANIFDNAECKPKIVMAYGYKDKDGQRPTINADKGALTVLVSDDTTPHSMKDLIAFDVAGYDFLTANIVGWGDNVGGISELVVFKDGSSVPAKRYKVNDYLISGTQCITINVSGWNTLSIDAISPNCVPKLLVGIVNPILYRSSKGE